MGLAVVLRSNCSYCYKAGIAIGANKIAVVSCSVNTQRAC